MENILVVDDEQGILDICEMTLKLKGYNVFTALSANDALKILESEPVELALVDLRMPQFDGNELLKKIKQSYPFTEVVIITAEATLDAAIEALKNGAFDYILKPFNLTELSLSVKRALEYTNLRRKENIFSETTYLYQMAHEIDKYHSMDELMKLILERSLKLLESEKGTVFSFDNPSAALQPVFSIGYELHELNGAKLSDILSKRFSSQHEPVLLPEEAGKNGINLLEFCPKASSGLIVPLEKHDILLGALVLFRSDGSAQAKFTKHDLDSLQVFATHASLIIALQHRYPLQKNDIFD